ncbi:hypothetical protein DPMN_047644 [Dreissena polymorpha]|uniref:Uncharacterized protein n=1 Tax=Dreissena polymorpha TaxID=45954 RepID=A0A9D4D936_DREPO|nr:hypothetical protein DPMN_047644 [Dreissena polymorpha]
MRNGAEHCRKPDENLAVVRPFTTSSVFEIPRGKLRMEIDGRTENNGHAITFNQSTSEGMNTSTRQDIVYWLNTGSRGNSDIGSVADLELKSEQPPRVVKPSNVGSVVMHNNKRPRPQ